MRKKKPFMTDDQIHAADALVAWFKSQDIDPEEAIPIMALGICIATISAGENFSDDVDRVIAASRLVTETFQKILDQPETFKEIIK